MTGKLMLVPDTHVVVPNAPSIEMIDAGYIAASEHLPRRAHPISKIYEAMMKAAPQLTTPPVLRWEGEWLWLGTEKIAVSTEDYNGCFWVTLLQNDIGGKCASIDEGKRAAEKALGIPFEVEKV